MLKSSTINLSSLLLKNQPTYHLYHLRINPKHKKKEPKSRFLSATPLLNAKTTSLSFHLKLSLPAILSKLKKHLTDISFFLNSLKRKSNVFWANSGPVKPIKELMFLSKETKVDRITSFWKVHVKLKSTKKRKRPLLLEILLEIWESFTVPPDPPAFWRFRIATL